MRANATKEKLRRGERAYGYGVRFFGGTEVARFAAAAGFDFLFVDAEHSAFSLETTTALLRAALEAGVTPIARVCGFDHHLPTRLLDNGAQGIIFPHVETVAQVEHIGRELFFPPRGARSLPGPMAIHDFCPIPAAELMARANETTLAVAMIEHPDAVARLEELLAPGVLDVAVVGANDLAATLGVPGQFEHPKFGEAVEALVGSCKRAGVASGIGGLYVTELLAHWAHQGMTFLYCANDGQSLIHYPTQRLREIKAALEP